MILVVSSVMLSMTCSVLVYSAMVMEDYPAAAAIAVLGICLTNTVSGLGRSKPKAEIKLAEPPVWESYTWTPTPPPPPPPVNPEKKE